MNLYVKESGVKNAPSIVFLHGIGVSSWMWADQITSLEQDYHCLTIDLPGNGESYQTEWCSFADSAAQIATIIRMQATNAKAHVVGLSLGGYLALHLLRDHPDGVETMIVSGVTTRPFTGIMRLMGQVMPPLLKFEPLVNLSARMMQLPAEAIPLYKRDSQRVSTLTFKRVYNEVLDFQLPGALAQRSQRLLAVAGDSEAGMVTRGLTDFPALLPNARSAIAANAHHGWNGEHPELFTAMIRAWIENQPLPAGLTPVL